MGNELTVKTSFFTKIVDTINRIFRKEEQKEFKTYSRFKHFLDGLEKDTEEYKNVDLAVILCDESLNVVSQRLMLIEKLKDVSEKMVELDCYDKLTQIEATHLKDLLDRFSSLAKDKNTLKYQVTGFNKSVTFMSELEQEAPGMIGEIKEAEDKQRMFKQDIGYLQGEKSELEYERENLSFALDFIYKFTIGLVVFFAIATSIIVFMYAFKEANILFPMSVMAFLVITMTAMLQILRRKLQYELKLNYRKQNRAVELLNKKNVVCAHYTNFLNFEYKKFKVRNAEMLQNNLKEYAHYKHVTKRFDSIRSIMYQTEEEIERFLREKNITNISTTVENFAKTVNVDDKKQYHRELMAEKKALEQNLTIIDSRQEGIWDTLVSLNEKDVSVDHIVDEIIKTYIDEAGKIVSRPLKLIREVLDTESDNLLDKEKISV